MPKPVSVKVGSRYRVVIPRVICECLSIRRGDRLLVDIQDGLLILIPQFQDYVAHMAGLRREVWADLDTTAYVDEEREAWVTSE